MISVILPIQRGEFDVDISADEQPNLRVIPDFYQSGKGQFSVAMKDGAIVGTIGLPSARSLDESRSVRPEAQPDSPEVG